MKILVWQIEGKSTLSYSIYWELTFLFISVIAPTKLKYMPVGVGLGAAALISEDDYDSESEASHLKV